MLKRRSSLHVVVPAWAVIAISGCPSAQPNPSAPGDAAAQQSAAGTSSKSTPAPVRFTEQHDPAIRHFKHHSGFAGAYRLQEIMGSGAALFDFDGDGKLDIYLVNGDRSLTDELQSRPARGDCLLRQGGDGAFVDVTAASGITSHGFGMGAACADYDNDGDIDLLLTGVGQLQLFRNNGEGTFTDVSAAVGITDQPWCVAAAFADFNRDGWLDLVAVNYVQPDDTQQCFDKAGRPEFCGPQHYQALADVIFRNDSGLFTNVSASAGISSKRGPGLGVMCVDFTGDGLVDFYVANDAAANFLWVNQGDFTFIERATQLGCAFNREGAAEASMGVTIGDVTGDGAFDLFLTHLDSETNTLYQRHADGTFADVTAITGLGPPSLPVTGFGTAMFDADLDGDLDIVVVNGAIKRHSQEFAHVQAPDAFRLYAEPRQIFLQAGDRKFTAYEGESAGLGPAEVSRGLAVGDVNRDGALDCLVVADGAGARLFMGAAPRDNHFLTVQAFDTPLRRDALGAIVTIDVNGVAQQRHILASYSYAASCQPIAHFGLGANASVDAVTIEWPDGVVERFPGARANVHLVLQRGEGEAVTP